MWNSCPTVEDRNKRIGDTEKILNESGFSIKELHCSSPELQEIVNTKGDIKLSEEAHANVQHQSEENAPQKSTEVSWNPNSDTIHFRIYLKKASPFTKRSVLSNISRIFDPLGLATALTIRARIALQEVWKMKKYDWDDPLPKSNKKFGIRSSKRWKA